VRGGGDSRRFLHNHATEQYATDLRTGKMLSSFYPARMPRISRADLGDIERRMQSLERSVQRVAGRTSASVTRATDHAGDAIVAALGDVIDRFRGSARAVGNDANRLGQQAARMGNVALHRLSDEVEHRPLTILAVAIGIGFVAGLAGRRH